MSVRQLLSHLQQIHMKVLHYEKTGIVDVSTLAFMMVNNSLAYGGGEQVAQIASIILVCSRQNTIHSTISFFYCKPVATDEQMPLKEKEILW